MLINEQQYFLKDFFIIFSALFGTAVLIFIQLKNSGIRFRPFGRRKSDFNKIKKNNKKIDKLDMCYSQDWIYSKETFEISSEDFYIIWFIGVFSYQKTNLTIKLHKLYDYYWYKFANSKLDSEKIMAPLFRKIFNKYKNMFESEKSLQFVTQAHENVHLYTWLKNPSHIHTAIYNFLDECIGIAKELKVKPNLTVTLSDCITAEITMPPHDLLILFENEFKDLYGVDFTVNEYCIKIKLWIAFSENKIPDICTRFYSKAKILPEERKAS